MVKAHLKKNLMTTNRIKDKMCMEIINPIFIITSDRWEQMKVKDGVQELLLISEILPLQYLGEIWKASRHY
jgi:hypothetical protein